MSPRVMSAREAIPTVNEASLTNAATAFSDGYALEIFLPGAPAVVIDTFVFPLAPQRYSLTEPFAANLTPTEGNSIAAEEYGILLREIQIEGTFGIKARRSNGGDPISGNDSFILLRKFFRRYSELKQADGSLRNVQMRWHAVRDDDHFVVVPKSFETPRDTKSTRNHYMYRISLTAVAEIETEQTTTGVAEVEGTTQTITRALNDARGVFVTLSNETTQLRVKISDIQTVVNNAAAFMRSAGAFVRAGSDLIFFPLKLAVQTLDEIDRTCDDLADAVIDSTAGRYSEPTRDLRKLHQSLSRIAAFPDKFVESYKSAAADEYAGNRRLTNRDFEEGTAGATSGSRFSITYGTDAQAGLDLGSFNTLDRVTVDRSTTLQSIAAKYGVAPEAIIVINDLRPPYFAPAGGPGLLGPGDTVLVPSPTGAAGTSTQLGSATDAEDTDELLYGRDFAIDVAYYEQTGLLDFKADEAHGTEDAEIVFGENNVWQSLTIILETTQGSTTFLPDIGIVARVGSKGTFANVLLATVALREAVLSDPRVLSIDKMELFLDRDVLYQEITPRLIDGRAGLPVAASLGRVQQG